MNPKTSCLKLEYLSSYWLPFLLDLAMPPRTADARVIDVGALWTPRSIGTAMARLWTIDDQRLLPLVDVTGNAADRCPITLEKLLDPVLLSDGQVYERRAVLQWLAAHSSSPCTNKALEHKSVLKLLSQLEQGHV